MALIKFQVRINEDGKAEVDLPDDLPQGEYTALLELPQEQDENRPLTPEEIAEYLRFKGKTGKEIVEMGLLGGWEDMGIEDSVEWVKEQRLKRREARNNTW